jgi:hypothetical protein
MTTPTHLVLRPIPTAGRTYQPGDLVDARGWRTGERLVEQRRLRPLAPHELPRADEPATPEQPRRRASGG